MSFFPPRGQSFDLADTEEEISDLVKRGFDINRLCRRYGFKNTPFRFSIGRGDAEKCRLLLKYGAIPKYKDVFISCWNGMYDNIVLLINAGLDPNFMHESNGTPLEAVSNEGSCDMYDFLVSRGAIPTHKCLYYACSRGHIDIIDRLLRDNVIIDKDSKQLPLIAACLAKNPTNDFTLQELSYWDDTNIIDRLIIYGVEINARGFDGETALMIAVQNGLINIVHRLLDFGADMKLVDEKGNDINYYFNKSEHPHPEIAKIINNL